MKKTLLILITLGSLFALSACRSGAEGSLTSTPTSTSVISESTTQPTPTPIPTYAPGTELYGMLSVTGEVVIEPQYEYLDLFSEEGLARFKDHGLWGFVDERGIEVIEAQYEYALSFSDGLAAVEVDGLYGFVDTTGEMVIEPQYLGVGDGFHYGRCTFTENEMQGLIDKNGDVILDAKYKSIILKCENYFIIKNMQNEFGIIDRDGTLIVDCQYTEIYFVTDSGFYFVPGSENEKRDKMYGLEGNFQYTVKHILIDFDYPIQLLKQDSLINVSPDDVSPEANGTWGLFDLATGTYVIEPIYDSVGYEPGDSFAFISLGDYWGVADASTGEIILDCINKKCNKKIRNDYIVYEGLEDHWGVMKLDGTSVLPTEYENIACSPNGEFGVVKNNKSFLLDAQGNTIKELLDSVIIAYVPSIDRWIYTNEYNVEYISLYGVMNRDGSIFIEPSFDEYYIYSMSLIDSYSYPNAIDLTNSSLIIDLRATIEGGGYPVYAVVSINGYSVDSLYRDFEFFPDQKVLVVTDKNGNSGLVSYDGTVLFELQACQFFINDVGYHNPNKNFLFYDEYNDTDYLIYTVKSK